MLRGLLKDGFGAGTGTEVGFHRQMNTVGNTEWMFLGPLLKKVSEHSNEVNPQDNADSISILVKTI